jgi:hypothetical protein
MGPFEGACSSKYVVVAATKSERAGLGSDFEHDLHDLQLHTQPPQPRSPSIIPSLSRASTSPAICSVNASTCSRGTVPRKARSKAFRFTAVFKHPWEGHRYAPLPESLPVGSSRYSPSGVWTSRTRSFFSRTARQPMQLLWGLRRMPRVLSIARDCAGRSEVLFRRSRGSAFRLRLFARAGARRL